MKKLLSTLIAFLFILTVLPVQSFAADLVYEPPTEAFLKNAVKKSKGSYLYLEMNKKGKWSVSDENGMYDQMLFDEMELLLSEEFYNETMKEYAKEEGIKSYAEYKEYMIASLKEMGYDYPPKASEPKIYVRLYCNEKNDFGYTRNEIFLKGAEYVLSVPKNNASLMKKIAASVKTGSGYYFEFDFEATGNDMLKVQGIFISAKDYISGADSKAVRIDEAISISGKKGIVLGDTFVPADTEKLCISSRTSSIVDMLWSDKLPEDCVIAAAVPGYGSTLTAKEDTVYDLAEIAKTLPNLKELYIFQGAVKDPKKITSFKKLETLYYYATEFKDGHMNDVTDKSFKKMKSLRKLGLFADYSSYDFLSEMTWLKDVYAEVSGGSSNKLSKIFGCKSITGLKLDDVKDISGIEKLTKLKDLDIDSNGIKDYTPLSKLKNLEKLSVRALNNAKGISSIAKLTKLKELSLMSMDKEDLSFVGKMTGLRKLSLSYVNSSFTKSIGDLTGLEQLNLNSIGANGGGYGWGGSYNMSFLPKLKSLKELLLMGNKIDISGISKLTGLKNISIMLCEFDDLSELKKCPALDSLVIYNNTSKFDAKWLSGSNVKELWISAEEGVNNIEKLSESKKLRKLSLDFTGIPESTVKKIKKALPKCKIEVYELRYNEAKVY